MPNHIFIEALPYLKTNAWNIHNATVNALQKLIEKHQLIIQPLLTVIFFPFSPAMGIEPLVLGRDSLIGLKPASGMQTVIRPCGTDKGRDNDLFELWIGLKYILIGHRVEHLHDISFGHLPHVAF